MANGAKVSVVIPCYNQGQFVAEAIESVKQQTYPNWELIVVNDGSTDDETNEILTRIDAEDPAVTVITQANKGLPAARNSGIKRAKGTYIVCLDADDMLAKDYLQKTVAMIDATSNKKVAVVTTWLQEFGIRKDVWKAEEFNFPKLLITNVLHAGSLFKKDVWQEVGGYAEDFRQGYEDWDFWLSVVEKGYAWTVIPEPLFSYRIRADSMLAGSRQMHTEIYGKLYERHHDLFAKYEKQLLVEYARQAMELRSIIQEDNKRLLDSAEILDAQRQQIQSLKDQVLNLRQQLQDLLRSRLIRLAIKTRDKAGNARHKVTRHAGRVARTPRVAAHHTRVVVAPFIPRPVRKSVKKAYGGMRQLRIKTVFHANEAWPADRPLVSVVIPYYNRADTIDETLDSLRDQTFQNFEIILVDDGSTDPASVQKLDEIRKSGLHAQIIHQENQGVATARNTGIAKSRGKYIICLDSDDILTPTFIEKCTIVLEADPDVSLVTTHQEMFGVINENFTKVPYDPYHLFVDNMVITAAAYRREAWEASGGYKSGIGYEDWEFWINLSEKGFWGRLIPEFIFRYRTAEQSRYVDDKSDHLNNMNRIRELHPNYARLIRKIASKRKYLQTVVDPTKVFINLSHTSTYAVTEYKKPNMLIAVPWMTFGGAETLILNFCHEIKNEYNLSFVTGLLSGHEWEDKFRQITTSIYHLPNLFDDEQLYLEFISNYVTSRQIDILHIIHTDFVFDMLPELKRRHPELKVVVTMFNARVGHFEKSIAAEKYIDAFISDNMAVSRSYKEKLTAEKQVTVIPNGINSIEVYSPALYDRDQERAKLGLNSDDIAVFFIGRLSEEKNPDVFLEVAAKLVASPATANVKFFVIGDGAMRPVVEKMVKNIASKNVKYLGYQSDIARYLSAADIFVLPSAIEGFPLSILEAMAMNVAVVASDVGAVADVITSDEDGIVVTPGSASEISRAIITLSGNPQKLRDMKAKARTKIDKKYSNLILGRNYKKFYADILNRGQKAARG